jgi:hypothetical protein
MFALMEEYYDGVTRVAFEADLDEKQWVIQLTDPLTGAICGFSTQMLIPLEIGEHGKRIGAGSNNARPVSVLFSGDTIVRREHWGSNPLAQQWGRLALRLIDAFPDTEWYWFLTTKGYRTYRFLPVFFHEFYPRHDIRTPEWAARISRAAALAKCPADYDPDAGIIRVSRRSYRLREGVANVSASRLGDPHIRFFVGRNPRHDRGDELCCIAPLARENFTRAAYRVIGPQPAAVTTVS